MPRGIDTARATPVNPYDERLQIVRALRPADAVVGQLSTDLVGVWKQLQFTTLFLHAASTPQLDPDLRRSLQVITVPRDRRSASVLAHAR